MKKIITSIALFVAVTAGAAHQFDQGSDGAFNRCCEEKNTEASAMFERIAVAEPNSWLPNYYIALVNTTTAFTIKDKDQINTLLTKAQNALDVELIKTPNNSELIVLQALIHTAWVAFDPMINGQKLSGTILELYAKAIALDPNNPRAVAGKAEYEIGGAKFWGTDTKPMCAQIEKAIGLFATFKPETAFSPKWGLERAQATLKACNK